MPDFLDDFNDVPDSAESGARHDAAGVAVGPYLHGSGGLFNMDCTDTPVISAIMSPLTGLAPVLPVINGEYGTGRNSVGGVDAESSIAITGVTEGDLDDFDNQPTEDCDLGPEGGLLKAGQYKNPYGRIRGSTKEVSIYRAGRAAEACEPLTLRLLNQPGGFEGMADTSMQPSLQNAMWNEMASRIFTSLHTMQRMFSRRLWIGNPANNVGERRDIWGLDQQLNVGTHRDSVSSALLTALDSDVKDFGFDCIGANGRSIMEYIEEIDNYITWNAEGQRLDPFDYYLVMRPGAWRAISQSAPIDEVFYAVRQIAAMNNTNISLNFNASDINKARNTMRKSRLLPVNGEMRQVILDTSIPELTPVTSAQLTPGKWASKIYFVPRTIRGNMAATFWKYFNHANGQSEAIAAFAGPYGSFTSDNGLFRWYVRFTDGCLKLGYEFGPKLVVLTPQLGGVLQNVCYSPLQHERDAYPDSSYFFNGGNTNSPVQRYYVGWSATQQSLS